MTHEDHIRNCETMIGNLEREVAYLREQRRFEPWPADPVLDAQIQAATAKTTEELRDAFNAYGTARDQETTT